MKDKYIIAHDVGTSSSKAILMKINGEIVKTTEHEYPIYYPKPSMAEQIPSDYWKAIVKGTKEVLEKSNVHKDDVLGIVHTTQAMGIIPVDIDGNILRNNISWVDSRAEKEALKLMKRIGGRKVFKAFVGLELMGKDVMPKLRWIKDNERHIYDKTHKFLDVNGYLRFMATGKMTAEYSGACSYGLDLKTKNWMPFFSLFGISMKKLPDLVKSTDVVGNLTKKAASELGLNESTLVFGGCDDTQSAAIGSTATHENEAHIYLGTSAWVGVTVSKDYGFKNGAATLASADPDKNIIVGITESAGSNIEWIIERFFADDLSHGEDIFEIYEREMKNTPPGSKHLIMTPWFLGERCPVSTTTTRSTVFNLGLEHTRGDFARSACEAIGYNIRWIIENYEKDFKIKIDSLKVIGGGSVNDTWMQGLADITKKEIVTTTHPKNAGAIGAGICALVGLKIIDSFQDVNKIVNSNKSFKPNTDNFEIYDKLFSTYQRLYKDLKKTYKNINKERF